HGASDGDCLPRVAKLSFLVKVIEEHGRPNRRAKFLGSYSVDGCGDLRLVLQPDRVTRRKERTVPRLTRRSLPARATLRIAPASEPSIHRLSRDAKPPNRSTPPDPDSSRTVPMARPYPPRPASSQLGESRDARRAATTGRHAPRV